jgi:sRNA-binding carbon storage regulator CsrA
MLILNPQIGESIRIGDDVRLTILATLGAQLTVALAVPANLAITDDTDTTVRPVRQRQRRDKRYLIAIMLGESLRIGEEVIVSFGDGPAIGSREQAGNRRIRVDIDAPRATTIQSEAIHECISRGEPAPCRERI